MKRKTIVTIGVTGALLAGVSATALMGYQFFNTKQNQIKTQVQNERVDQGGAIVTRPELQVQPEGQPRTRVQPQQQAQPQMQTPPQPPVQVQPQYSLDDKRKRDQLAGTSGLVMEQERDASGERYRPIAPAEQFVQPLRPGPGNEKYGEFEDNPVTPIAEQKVSTFSIDVDTASYAVVRRYLEDGMLPPRDAVRTEELVNYFNYDYAMPESQDEPFAADVAVYDTPWSADTQIIRIGLQGYDIPAETRPAANLVFLVDTSGSMNSADKLPLLKKSLRMLVDQMDEDDTIAIVAYAGSAGVVLEPTKGSERRRILSALNRFRASGSTAGAAGIRQAYALAEANYQEGAVNRVILATDGDFNVGTTENSTLEQYIARKRKTGIYLSILGFGRGNYKDDRMQVLAQAGNGNAAYIDDIMEARKVLVDEMGSTLFAIANDVKIQVEFNPAYVAEYRLIGYETRLLERKDFNNDKVDAGEVGSGHEVTALYEITPPDSKSRLIDDLRYGEPEPEPAAGVENGEIAFLRLRYKLPGEARSTLWEQPILAEARTSFAEAPAEARFATAVAGFGQLLRGTVDMGDFSWGDVFSIARAARGEDAFGYRSEFIRLVQLAESAHTPELLNN
jgi:Ca-activated chloride channel family protein